MDAGVLIKLIIGALGAEKAPVEIDNIVKKPIIFEKLMQFSKINNYIL